jgi:hypothetical protein
MHKNAPRSDLHAPEIQTAVVFDNVERDEHRFECIVGAIENMDTISMTAMFSLRMVPTSEGNWAIAVSMVICLRRV